MCSNERLNMKVNDKDNWCKLKFDMYLIYVFLVVSPSYLYVLYLFVLYVKIMCFSLNHMSKGMHHKKLSVFNKHTAVTVMEINILILIILLYILKPEWESSLPYALCNLNLCFVLFLWGYIYSQRWVGMLCATLPYALCNFFVGIYSQAWVGILTLCCVQP